MWSSDILSTEEKYDRRTKSASIGGLSFSAPVLLQADRPVVRGPPHRLGVGPRRGYQACTAGAGDTWAGHYQIDWRGRVDHLHVDEHIMVVSKRRHMLPANGTERDPGAGRNIMEGTRCEKDAK